MVSVKNPTWELSDILHFNICFEMSKWKKEKSLTETIFDTKNTNPSNTKVIAEGNREKIFYRDIHLEYYVPNL